MLDKSNHQGKFGADYVRVLASAAGLIWSQDDVDLDGVDLCIKFPGRTPRGLSPRIDVQVKSVSRLTVRHGYPYFDFGIDVTLPLAVGEADSIGRRTAERVHLSSKAVAEVLHSEADGGERLHDVDVSDQVCRALAGLAGPDRVTLGFRWAGVDSPEATTVEIPGGASEVIRAAIRARRRHAPSAVGAVQGPVIELADDAEGDRRRITVRAVLRIDGATAGRRRAVIVRLPGDREYRVAPAAHRDGRAVRAEGQVTPTGRRPGIDVTTGGFTVVQDLPI